ncbi:hypothetical protein [Echinicola sp. 20G]|uniref:hypothetical protein n=1 Tax=Echinicola sp. 20G TaxID=2781961 RepID=UPI001F1F32E9|nr:hypothetical protein [Echinicola sp. 20G]
MNVRPIFKGKCPKCNSGEIFKTTRYGYLVKFPEMHHVCDKCNHTFEREPGFFFGAMYVSYGLSMLEFLILWVVGYLIIGLSVEAVLVLIISGLLICTTTNYRLGRIIWIYLFAHN